MSSSSNGSAPCRVGFRLERGASGGERKGRVRPGRRGDVSRVATEGGMERASGAIRNDGPAFPDGRTAKAAAVGFASQSVRFEHRCPDPASSQVQGYAEVRSKDERSGALVRVYACRDAMLPGEIVIGIRLVAMRLESGRENGERHWSVSVDARSPATRVAGVEHSHYFYSPVPGEGRRRPFRTDGKGVLEWSDHPIPGAGNRIETYPQNWSPKMESTASALGLTDGSREAGLTLVMSDVESGNTVRFSEIAIRIPDRIWQQRPGRLKMVRVLSKLERIGPPRLWRRLARGARCRACQEAQRSARLAFAANWSTNDG